MFVRAESSCNFMAKQFKNFSVKDLENYLSDRAKRSLILPQGYRKVDRVIDF